MFWVINIFNRWKSCNILRSSCPALGLELQTWSLRLARALSWLRSSCSILANVKVFLLISLVPVDESKSPPDDLKSGIPDATLSPAPTTATTVFPFSLWKIGLKFSLSSVKRWNLYSCTLVIFVVVVVAAESWLTELVIELAVLRVQLAIGQ